MLPSPCVPVHRSILVVDIESSTGPLRTDPIKRLLRHTVYDLLGRAFLAAGIDPGLCEFADRGDGVLVLVRPSDRIPKTLLLNPLAPELARLLADYNHALPQAEKATRELRLRLAVHAGEVHSDANGLFGEEIDVACRLLDAKRVKDALRDAAGPLVLVVSEDIYWSIVKHRYDGICAESFVRAVRVTCGGRSRRGWVNLPVPAAVLVPVQPLRLGAA